MHEKSKNFLEIQILMFCTIPYFQKSFSEIEHYLKKILKITASRGIRLVFLEHNKILRYGTGHVEKLNSKTFYQRMIQFRVF